MLCPKIVIFVLTSKQYLYTTCSELVFFREFNEQSLLILWVSWCKDQSFWKRFTCTTVVKDSPRKRKPSRKKLDLLDNEEIVDLAKPLMKKKKVSLSQLLDGLDESKFTCYYCDKMFCNRKFLNEHYKKHLDSNGTLPCKYCEKRYPSFRKITCHIRSTHDTG